MTGMAVKIKRREHYVSKDEGFVLGSFKPMVDIADFNRVQKRLGNDLIVL